MKKISFIFSVTMLLASVCFGQQNVKTPPPTGTNKPVKNNESGKNGGSTSKQQPEVQSMPLKNFDPYTNTTVDPYNEPAPNPQVQQKKTKVKTGKKN